MFGRSVPSAVVGALLLLACTASESPPRLGSTQQSNQGALTSSNRFAVGVCLKASGPGACGGTCTGTLIAPNLVLTARHCVDLTTNSQGMLLCGVDAFTTRSTTPAQTWITTGPDMLTATPGWHAVTEIHTPSATEACSSDLALLVLDAAIPANEAKPADVLAFGPMTDHARYSTEVTLIGYGLSDPTVPSSLGRRRILQHSVIDCIPGDPVFRDAFCTGGGVSTTADGGTVDSLDDNANFGVSHGACAGDSGGGAYEQASFTAGVPLVMGVQSRGDSQGHVCVGLAFTRTDFWRDFLVASVTAAAQSGGYTLPTWATGPTVKPPDAGAPVVDATIPEDAGERASCTHSTECADGACVAVGSAPASCVAACGPGRTCAAQGDVCSTVEGAGDVCLPAVVTTSTVLTKAESGGGCAVAPSRKKGVSGALVGGGLAALAWAVRLATRKRRRGQRG